MLLVGIAVTLLGFAIAFVSLGAAASTGVRMAMSLAGLAVSLFGIVKVLNGYYLKNAIWRR